MESILRDIRFALTMLARERGFSSTVLLTLGVCVATNVVLFGVVRAVVLDPLPFEDPDDLVTLYNSYPGTGAERSANGVPDYFMRRQRIDGLESIAAYRQSGVAVGGESGAEQVPALRVTPSFFPTLRVEARSGRIFLEEEMEPGAAPTVVITHGYWSEALGGDLSAVGTTLRIDGTPTTIVGILPADFNLPSNPDARLLLPLSFTAEERSLERWHSNSLQMLARLTPGSTPERVQVEIDALNASLIAEAPIPNLAQILADARFRTVVVDARADLTRDVRSLLFLLWGGAGFVLLIGCVNIANLILARAEARGRELATRMSLGARRGRIARQMLTEAAVIGLLGAVVGTGLSLVGLRLLSGLGVEGLLRGSEVALGVPVLLYAVALALLAALVFGAIPVVHLFRADLGSVFREESRGGTSGRASVLFRNGLVVGQITLAFVLLVGAGLMFQSFQAALDVDPGFQPAGVLTGTLVLPDVRYPDATSRRAFVRTLVLEASALPGVSSAGITTQLPLGRSTSSSVIFPEGYTPRPGESIIAPRASVIGPGYLQAMGIELVRGRGFADSDDTEVAPVLIVDEWLANRFWPEGDALGQRMVFGAVPGSDEAEMEENIYTIVGIAENVKFGGLTEADDEYVGSYYMAHAQDPANYFTIAVRTAGDPIGLVEPMRSVVAGLDIELPLFDVATMEDRIGESLAFRRATMTILLVFAGVALALSVVGVYGVLAYTVARRTREIGIRMAVGSDPGAVFGLVLRKGLGLTALGLLLGSAAAVGLTRFLESFLFGVRPADPLVLVITAGILMASATVACAVPARRATRVDPNRALAAG